MVPKKAYGTITYGTMTLWYHKNLTKYHTVRVPYTIGVPKGYGIMSLMVPAQLWPRMYSQSHLE